MALKIVMDGVASYKAPATIELDKKVTLVYGLNGAGKSTISNYLYKPDGTEYSNCRKSGFDDVSICVYNSRFVKDNFFEVDKLNGIFTLSKVNKEVEENIVKLNVKLKELDTKKSAVIQKQLDFSASAESLRSTAEERIWKIKTQYSGGDRVLEYCLEGLKSKARLFEHISSLSHVEADGARAINSIKKEVEALQGDNAQTYFEIPKIITDRLALEIAPVLKQIIVGKSDSPVAGLISRLHSADWVSEGIKFAEVIKSENDDTCPFCQAKTLRDGLITHRKRIRCSNEEPSAMKIIASDTSRRCS